jgi:hypothetical protein
MNGGALHQLEQQVGGPEEEVACRPQPTAGRHRCAQIRRRRFGSKLCSASAPSGVRQQQRLSRSRPARNGRAAACQADSCLPASFGSSYTTSVLNYCYIHCIMPLRMVTICRRTLSASRMLRSVTNADPGRPAHAFGSEN